MCLGWALKRLCLCMYVHVRVCACARVRVSAHVRVCVCELSVGSGFIGSERIDFVFFKEVHH